MMDMNRGRVASLLLAAAVGLGCGGGNPEDRDPTILAELQVWHGSAGHARSPYESRDPAVIARQLASAREAGICAFVIDWYGPACGAANDAERAFQDEAAAAVRAGAEDSGFKVALLYDEGTIERSGLPTDGYQARAVSDLDSARSFFGSDAYLREGGGLILFVYPYDSVDPRIDWCAVRRSLALPLVLIDKDPNPLRPERDAAFDGFYAWVSATNGAWDPKNGTEWGEAYLGWFYATMASTAYSGKVAVGGVWPGFDDSLATWGKGRFMARRGTATYDATMALARDAKVPYIMIETWNDFDEGTDVEFGREMLVDMDEALPLDLIRSSPLRVTWSAGHANTVLQVYKNGGEEPLYDAARSAGAWLGLRTGDRYELKLWHDGSSQPLSRWVAVRRQDAVPGITPIDADP
jgi:hypothetical protein